MNRVSGAASMAALAVLSAAVAADRPSGVSLAGKGIRLEFNQAMHSRVVALLPNGEIALGDFTPSEIIRVAGKEVTGFTLSGSGRKPVADRIGRGVRWVVRGAAGSLVKTVTVTFYDEFPRLAFFDVEYANRGTTELAVNGWANHSYRITADERPSAPAFWSYQSGSYSRRPDWVLPLKPGFKQANFQGMNATDYGGGTPVADVWRPDVGLGVGHIELAPKLVSLPVAMPDEGSAAVAVSCDRDMTLKPGEALRTLRTFVAVHQGDYFETLASYRRVMTKQGFAFQPAPDSAFEPIWCAWGYGRKFQPAQVYGALPIVKKLGFGWVTLDDGWQTSEGDWFLDRQKFPAGDSDLRAMVDRLHAEGFKAQLWWAPLAADPGTELVAKHPDWLLLNADGSRQRISWWNSWYLCPADPRVARYHQDLVTKILRDWGFDGLKLDGQHMNGAPPCYNPAHRHARPEESVEAMPLFFKALYETARKVKPEALVEFCPCGTAYSFFTLPYMNMSVAADPRSSWQIRLKGKTLKALAGDAQAYFGDHVEMSEGGVDFASTLGVGGVIGTNFTWPPGSAERGRLDLTPEKEQLFQKWIGIYRQKMLSRGEYLGALYDIGFDRPEAHVIRKGDAFYYAFFAPSWSGDLELRGLANRSYRVTGYEDGKDFGSVRGPRARLRVELTRRLLLEARPE